MALLASASGFAQQFFEQVNYRGAVGSVNWTSPWANWNPNATLYPGDAGGPADNVVNVSGDITTNTTWSSGNVYIATGTIKVKNGATLTIEPGVTVRGNNSGNQNDRFVLMITKGSKLNAVGTPAQPIVFTSGAAPGNRQPGDWGGLLLIGNGITNLRNQGTLPDGQGQYEALPSDPDAAYGGSNPNDNSGNLQYVRIEYAGYNFLPNQEINGLTFAAVGSGTTVENVMVSYANDDAFEWFGGSVNCKRIIALGAIDDDFDADEGYNGKVQFALGIKHPSFSDQAGTSNGFEHDNNTNRTATAGSGKVPNVNNPAPVTMPTFSNVTLVGPIRSGETVSNLPANHKFGSGVLLRSNNSTSLFNSIVFGYPTAAINLGNGAASIVPSTHTKASVDSVSIRNTSVFSTGTVLTQGNVPSTTYGGAPFTFTTANYFATAGFENSIETAVANFGLVAAAYTGPANGSVNQISFAGVNYSTTSSTYLNNASFVHPKLANFLAPSTGTVAGTNFFEQVNFRGAFGTTNWAAGWSNFTPESTVYPGDPGYTGAPKTRVNVSGDITTNTIWTSNNVYYGTGIMHVRNGATLTIQPGTVIRGENGSGFGILVAQGSKIDAKGTLNNPIVFTSGAAPGSRFPGDWSGLLIIGRAKTNLRNQPGGLLDGTGQYEALPNDPYATYGGPDSADNSGALRYVRIEYAGENFLPNQEINGLTFAAVGSATEVDYVQVSYANDDAFEWFGGSVNCKHIISLGAIDDDFDADEGYNGRVQFGLAVKHPSFWDAAGTSNGLEHDNNTARSSTAGSGKVPNVNNPAPNTRPIFSNITLVGPIKPGETRANLTTGHLFGRGCEMRTGVSTSLFNSIVMGFPEAIRFGHWSSSVSPSVQTKVLNDSAAYYNNVFTTNNTPDVLFGSTNSPVAFVRGDLEAAPRNNTFTAATSANQGLVAPFYAGASNAAASSIDFSGVNYTLNSNSPNLNAADWSHPYLRAYAVPSDLIVTGTQAISNGVWNNVTVTSTGVATLNRNVAVANNFNVTSGGSLTFGPTGVVSGAGNLNIGNGAIVSISGVEGLVPALTNAGNFANAGNRTFSATANYTFNGSNAQVTGAGFTGANNLTIDNAAGVTLSENARVNNILALKAGVFNTNSKQLTITSTQTSTGLIDDFTTGYTGSVTGNVRFERFNRGTFRHLSSPLTGARMGQYGAFCSSIRRFDEPTNSWITVPTLCTNLTLTPGTGNLVFNTGSRTSTFIGTATTGDVSVNLVRTTQVAGGPVTGWNSGGNPYPSPISWSAMVSVPGNTTNSTMAAWMWNSLTNVYATITAAGVTANGATDIIAPGQGIILKRNSIGNTGTAITFNNSVRRTNTATSLLRQQAPNFQEMVRLQLSGNGYNDEAVVYTQEGATNGTDAFDAEKLHSEVAEVSSIYTLAGAEQLIVNAQPATSADRVIPVGIKATFGGQYTITATEISNLAAGKTVLLEDRALNKFINLSAEPTYTFTMGEGTSEQRFALHFTSGNSGSNLLQASVFANGNTVTINSSNLESVVTQVMVVDALGRVVTSMNNDAKSLNLSFQVATTPGIYFVKLTGPAGEQTKRVYLGQK